MRLSGQFPACLFIFWYKKISHSQKALKSKTSNFHSYRSLCAQKIVAFVVYCCLILFWWLMFACEYFYARQIFSKKKQAWNCPDNLILVQYFYFELWAHTSLTTLFGSFSYFFYQRQYVRDTFRILEIIKSGTPYKYIVLSEEMPLVLQLY